MGKHNKKTKKAEKPKKDGKRKVTGAALTTAATLAPYVPTGTYRQTHLSRILAMLAWAYHHETVIIPGPPGGRSETLLWPTPNGWTPGWLIGHPKIGGMTAERRLRELVHEGRIERRRTITVEGGSVAEYRLVTGKVSK